MNDTLQQALATVINKAVAGVDTATAFLSEQLPDVVHQLIVWKLVHYGFASFVCISLISLWVWGLRKMWKTGMLADCNEFCMCYAIFGGSGSLFAAITLYFKLSNLLQLWLAPKVWLIEYAADLVRKV